MALENLQQLYLEQLRDLYSAENQILEALPMMAERAAHPELKSGFQMHQRQTEEQVRRLEQIADSLGHYSTYQCKYGTTSINQLMPIVRKQGNAFLAAPRVEGERFHYFETGIKRLQSFLKHAAAKGHTVTFQQPWQASPDAYYASMDELQAQF